MNLPHDPQIAAWLAAGQAEGSPESLARALAATRQTRKRPRWTFPERWLPVQLTMTRTPSLRPILAIASLALLIVALVATALFIGSQRRGLPAPFGPARNGAVVYAEDGDLFIADELDGTPRPLVTGPDTDSDPVFSRQGDRIAFVRGGGQVMTVSPDGSDVRELASNMPNCCLRGNWGPSRLEWSPDGTALIATAPGSGLEQAFVIRSDGTGFRELDPGPNDYIVDAWWRPDGRHIALFTQAGSLYLADADGTNLRQLIEPEASSRSHEWSPDGKLLSFVSHGPGDIDQVSIADIDESGAMTAIRRARLDPAWINVASAIWSPDGSQLAVVQANGSREQIGVVDPDGLGFRIVWPELPHLSSSEATGWADEYLLWSPDGRSLVFTEVALKEDSPSPGPLVFSAGRTWVQDVATGQQTEVDTPVETWQRLAP